MREKLSHIWGNIQAHLFPELEESLGPLTEKHKKLISILELIRIESFLPYTGCSVGRPSKDRIFLARAFIAKTIYRLKFNNQLRDYLLADKNLRRVCGWTSAYSIPSESKFSRVFHEFSLTGLPEQVHAALIKYVYEDTVIGHVNKDSTPVEARGVAIVPSEEEKKAKKNSKERPTRIERQASGNMSLQEMLDELPRDCTFGKKKKPHGKYVVWKGYKLHLATDDFGIPLAAEVTAASLNDNQVAIPLAIKTDKVVDNFYDLMDSAYDVTGIHEHSRSLGHVPIIDCMSYCTKHKIEKEREKKARKVLGWEPSEALRYKERKKCEKTNGTIKDFYGADQIWYRGYAKVNCHVMFGVLALTASMLLNLLDTA